MTLKGKMDTCVNRNIQRKTPRTMPSSTSKSKCDVISNNIEQNKLGKVANTNHKNKFGTKKQKIFTAPDAKKLAEELSQKKIGKPQEIEGSTASKSECEVISEVIEKKKPGNYASINHKNSFGANNWNTFMASDLKRLSESHKKNNNPQKVVGSPRPSIVSTSKCEISEAVAKKPDNFPNVNYTNTSAAYNWEQIKASESERVVDKFPHKKNSKPQGLVDPKSSSLNNPLKSTKTLHTATRGERDKQNQAQRLPHKLGVGLSEHKLQSTNCQPVLNGSLSKSKSSINKELLTHKCSNYKERTLTKQIAMDCEMVGVEVGVNNSMVARVSLVNALGDCIYDKYVKPTEPILSYRTNVSGIRPKDLENATDFKIVQKEVADILKGRILVGHALKYDLSVLFLTHPKRAIRDTSKFQKFREGRTPALKKLAKKYLGVTIQEGEHSSVQDALAAMQLYRMFRKEWETSLWSKKTGKQKNKDVKNAPVSLIQSEV